MEIAIVKQQQVQAAHAALNLSAEQEEEANMAREMKAELKELQRFMKDTDKKLAKAKIPKKKSEISELKDLTSTGKKLTVSYTLLLLFM